MRQADPICMWCALADADRPVRRDARLGPITAAGEVGQRHARVCF
jgi:hypothetical protein